METSGLGKNSPMRLGSTEWRPSGKRQKISFTCTHMLRTPLSVKSRFKNWALRSADDVPPRHVDVLQMIEGV